jgi:hypothetical protein
MKVRNKRGLLAILACALLGALLWLVLDLRGKRAPLPTAQQEAAPAPAAPAISRVAPPAPITPATRRNSIGQPLDDRGRPIGPPTRQIRNPTITKGSVPLPPPLFDNARDRAAYKGWWVAEFKRRVKIYERINPRNDYPSPDAAERMLDQLYELSEPQRLDEPPESFEERSRKLMNQLYPDFLHAFGGATPYTIQSVAGDPMYGAPLEPPVQPPGTDLGAAPAEPPPPGKITPQPHPP